MRAGALLVEVPQDVCRVNVEENHVQIVCTAESTALASPGVFAHRNLVSLKRIRSGTQWGELLNPGGTTDAPGSVLRRTRDRLLYRKSIYLYSGSEIGNRKGQRTGKDAEHTGRVTRIWCRGARQNNVSIHACNSSSSSREIMAE